MRYNIKFGTLHIAKIMTIGLLVSTSISAKQMADNSSNSQAKVQVAQQSQDSIKKNEKKLKITNEFTLTNPLSGSFSTIDAKTIEMNSINQVEQALNGTISGLYSIRNGGQKFGMSSYNLYIRGKATTGDNTPLILVDGTDGNIDLLDPNEIESITVLKDAAELSMYGLRGANGVILVKTKRGSSTSNFMSVDVQFGVQTPSTIANKLNAFQYATLHNEANVNDGTTPIYTPDNYLNNNDIYGNPSTNLLNDFLKSNSNYKQYNFTAAGGNDIAKYFALVSYMRQDGIFNMPQGLGNLNQTYNERYNFRTNLDVKLGKGFVLTTNISAIFDDRRSPWISSTNTVNNSNDFIFNTLYSTPANAFPLLNPNGSLGGTSVYRNNPIGLLRSGKRIENTRQLGANVSLTKDLKFLLKGLSAEFQYAFENYNAYYKGSYTTFSVNKLKVDSTYEQYGVTDTKVSTTGGQMSDYYNDMTFKGGLKFDRSFGKHKVFASIIYNQHTTVNSGDTPPYEWLGTSSRISYFYDNRYFAQLSGSYQGSNSYASGKRYGFFPAASAGWVVSEENFLKTCKAIDYLKARASVGLTGNDRTGTTRFLYRQAYYNTGGYGFGNPNGTSQGSYEGTLGNPDGTWEKSAKLDVGFDLLTIKNTLSVTADYFYENRQDIMVNESSIVPNFIGVSLPQYNAGIINNKGLEADVKYVNKFGPVVVHVGANMLYAENTIVDLKESAYPDQESYRYRKGNSIDAVFGLVADGIYNNNAEIQQHGVISTYGTLTPGDIKYLDQNNDGIINDADKRVIGNQLPKFMYGLNGGIEVNGFDVNFQAEGSELYNVLIRPDQFSTYSFNNRWTDEQSGSNALYPRLSFASNNNNQTSTFWMEKGHLFRLAAIECGYSFPTSWVKKIALSNVRIYAKLNNVFSTTNSREGRDFEVPNVGYSQYPTMKTILFGLSVKL